MRGQAILTGLAIVAAVAAPGTAQSAVLTGHAAGGHNNVGATHSPQVERRLAGGGTAPPPDVRQRPGKGAVLGVDVASGNHPGGASIDWTQVAGAGYRFAFIKATEGSYYANPYYASDLANAKAAGLLVAAYHFANPNDSSGTLQADFAVDHAGTGSDGATLPLVADLEFDPYSAQDGTNECYGLTPPQLVSWIRAFVKEVHRRTGQLPAIYTVSDWWDKCTASSAAFAADPLWIADYAKADQTPSLPAGWSGYAYWQYTSTGKVPGISIHTDISALSPTALEVAAPGPLSVGVNSTPSVAVRSLDSGPALSYSATGLPAGLAIDPATGLISGTAPSTTVSGTASVTVTGTGLTPVTDPVPWYVHNQPDLQAPRARTGMTGGPQLVQVRAPDGLPGCTLTFTATGLPPGLQMSPCGLISGLLAKAGSYDPVISVSDSSGSVLAATPFSWQVHQPADTGPAGPIQLNHSRLCLGPTGSGIGLLQCRKGSAQSWTFTQYGAITLGRKCLASVTANKALRLRYCKGTIFQRWQLRASGVISNVQSGDCIAAAGRKAGAVAVAASCDGGTRQLWRVPPGPLVSALPGFCASAWEPAHVAPGPVRLRECRGGRATSWSVEPDGTLRSAGRCLALTFPAVAGAQVVLANCDGRAAEQWRVFGGPLAVQILSPGTGFCLATPGDQVLSPSLALGACTTTDPGATWRLG